jgi:hypothetical protein
MTGFFKHGNGFMIMNEGRLLFSIDYVRSSLGRMWLFHGPRCDGFSVETGNIRFHKHTDGKVA